MKLGGESDLTGTGVSNLVLPGERENVRKMKDERGQGKKRPIGYLIPYSHSSPPADQSEPSIRCTIKFCK